MSQCLTALYITAMVNHKQIQTCVKIQKPGVVTAALILCCIRQILALLCYSNYIFFLVEKWLIFLSYFFSYMCVCVYAYMNRLLSPLSFAHMYIFLGQTTWYWIVRGLIPRKTGSLTVASTQGWDLVTLTPFTLACQLVLSLFGSCLRDHFWGQ